MHVSISQYLSTLVKCHLFPSGVCHDAVSGWKGLSSPSHPHPGRHLAQSGTGCCWIQCHPVPQPCMMTPIYDFPFTSVPQPWPMALGARYRSYLRAPDHPQSDCWAEPRPIWLLSGAPYTQSGVSVHREPHLRPSLTKHPVDSENVPLRP